MPRVTVELTDKEIKEIIHKTKKSVAEGIKELILQNKDKLTLNEEQLRELITQVVSSRTSSLVSEIRKLIEEKYRNSETLKNLSGTLFSLKTDCHSLQTTVKELQTAVKELQKEMAKVEKWDTNLRVFVARKQQELEQIVARKLREIEKKSQPTQELKEIKSKAEGAAYWSAKLMLTVGELLNKVKKLEDTVIPIAQRFSRECCKSHYSADCKSDCGNTPNCKARNDDKEVSHDA